MKQRLALTALTDPVFDLDLQKAKDKYEKDSKNKLAMGKLKVGGDLVEVSLSGELTTNGYAHNKADWGESYSVGMRLDEPQIEMIQTLTQKVTDLCSGFEITDPVKDDLLYLKLKLNKDKKSFTVKSNVKLDPKKEAMITSGTEFTAFCEISAYASLENQKAGVTIKVLSLEFEE